MYLNYDDSRNSKFVCSKAQNRLFRFFETINIETETITRIPVNIRARYNYNDVSVRSHRKVKILFPSEMLPLRNLQKRYILAPISAQWNARDLLRIHIVKTLRISQCICQHIQPQEYATHNRKNFGVTNTLNKIVSVSPAYSHIWHAAMLAVFSATDANALEREAVRRWRWNELRGQSLATTTTTSSSLIGKHFISCLCSFLY